MWETDSPTLFLLSFKNEIAKKMQKGGFSMKLSEFDFHNAKIMISFPMGGKTDEECRHDYRRFVSKIKNLAGEENVKIINTYFGDDPNPGNLRGASIGVAYLARSIKAMSHATAVYFAPGWENARGCEIEHLVAEKYGITILED